MYHVDFARIKIFTMKKIIFLTIGFLFLVEKLSASEQVYESIFYNISINSNFISDDKIEEIEKIKIISLDRILKKF